MRDILLAAALAVALPATAIAKKAEVQCTDGSTSKAGRGACSHHGGIANTGGSGKADVEPSTGAQAPAQRARNQSREPADSSRVENNGGIFGRRGDTSPRSGTRDAKSGSPTA